MQKIKVAVVDDHPLVIDGIMLMLEHIDNIESAGSANTAEELFSLLASTKVDVLLLDISLKDETAFDFLDKLTTSYPDLKIIALSMHNAHSIIQRMFKAGIDGYVLKTGDKAELIEAINTVMGGENFICNEVRKVVMENLTTTSKKRRHTIMPTLSRREKEILRLICAEKTTSEIAEELFISHSTVETHRRNLLSKLGVRNAAGLVRQAIEKGLLDA